MSGLRSFQHTPLTKKDQDFLKDLTYKYGVSRNVPVSSADDMHTVLKNFALLNPSPPLHVSVCSNTSPEVPDLVCSLDSKLTAAHSRGNRCTCMASKFVNLLGYNAPIYDSNISRVIMGGEKKRKGEFYRDFVERFFKRLEGHWEGLEEAWGRVKGTVEGGGGEGRMEWFIIRAGEWGLVNGG